MKTLTAKALAALLAFALAAPAIHADNLQRFREADATLTEAEVADVYYASPGRKGFQASPDYTRLNELRAERDFERLLIESQAQLATDPTQLHPLFLLFAAASQLGRTDVKARAQWQINALCDAIFASGKGVMEQEPYRVVRSADISPFLLNYLYVPQILGTTTKGRLTATMVDWQGNEVYFFFEVADGR